MDCCLIVGDGRELNGRWRGSTDDLPEPAEAVGRRVGVVCGRRVQGDYGNVFCLLKDAVSEVERYSCETRWMVHTSPLEYAYVI